MQRVSGTWRRNPEGRWRLTPERLERLVKLQARLLDIAAPLVKPGRSAGLCRLARSSGRRRRPGEELLRPPFILDSAGCAVRWRACGRAGTAPDPGARRHRRLFRRAVRSVMLGRRDWLEILMRLTPLVLCLGLAASTLPVAVVGQRPDDQIAPKSVELLKQGETLLAQGKLIEADDALETALAVDPKNRAAFTVMARVAIKQKLLRPGDPPDQQGAGARADRPRRARGPGRGDGRAGRAAAGQGQSGQAAEAVRQAGCPQVACCRRRSPRARRWPRPRRPKLRRRTRTAARASATNSSTLTVSARRSGSIPSVASASSAPGTAFRLDRSILRRWPKAAAVSRSRTLRIDARRARRPARCGPPPRPPWAAARTPSGAPPSRSAGVDRHCAATDSRP